jgi:hypothetical protein
LKNDPNTGVLTTVEDILYNVISNPLYIGVYVYDGPEVAGNVWQISYISVRYKNSVSLAYGRYGSMENFHPNNRYLYIHVNRATDACVYVEQSYATLR